MKMNVNVMELGRAGEPMTKKVVVRMTPADYTKMQIVAKENGLKVSDYVRIATRRYTADMGVTNNVD